MRRLPMHLKTLLHQVQFKKWMLQDKHRIGRETRDLREASLMFRISEHKECNRLKFTLCKIANRLKFTLFAQPPTTAIWLKFTLWLSAPLFTTLLPTERSLHFQQRRCKLLPVEVMHAREKN